MAALPPIELRLSVPFASGPGTWVGAVRAPAQSRQTTPDKFHAPVAITPCRGSRQVNKGIPELRRHLLRAEDGM
ncbi:hypothetical protein GCM10022207_18390 [Streptomyces lannensis]|uniref:Uncharacterized protein n=1 Tax=Streptomyces lannensis TaxID=766498 RepID=A0ABP7JUG6_9ACTN